MSLYFDECIEEFDMKNEFVWVKRFGSDTVHRLRWKYPFLIKFIFAEDVYCTNELMERC